MFCFSSRLFSTNKRDILGTLSQLFIYLFKVLIISTTEIKLPANVSETLSLLKYHYLKDKTIRIIYSNGLYQLD